MILAALLLQTAYPPGPIVEVPSGTAITDADGRWSVTWDPAPSRAPRRVTATPRGDDRLYACVVTSVSATGASGRCWGAQSTTLPGTLIALQGLVISPVANAAAGLSINVIGSL